jgi:iron complex transport system ATP-binding protein
MIFSGVEFELRSGEVLTVLGTNGAGKSTLLNCIAGLLVPFSGDICFNGKKQTAMSYREIAKIAGYVPQIHNPTFAYTVLEYVVMGRTPYIGAFASPKPADYAIAEEAIARMRIAHLADKSCTEISGGERQLAAIARTVAQEAKLIILDEPTSHLDFGNQMKTVKLIKQLADEGYAVILTTHVPDHPVYLGGRVAIFENSAVTVGKVDDLISEERLSRLYGIPLKLAYTEEVARPICVAL